MGTSRKEFGEANRICIYDFDRNKNPRLYVRVNKLTHYDFFFVWNKKLFQMHTNKITVLIY